MKFKFTITGIDCPNCAAKLASIIGSKDGIDSCKINFLSEKVTVETTLTEDAALEIVRAAAKAFSSDITVE